MKIRKRQLKKLNQSQGYHFFDRRTMNFFNSTIETFPETPYFLFITSEWSSALKQPKRYTVRRFDPLTFEVIDISEFHVIETFEKAKKQLQQYKKDKFKADQVVINDLKNKL